MPIISLTTAPSNSRIAGRALNWEIVKMDGVAAKVEGNL